MYKNKNQNNSIKIFKIFSDSFLNIHPVFLQYFRFADLTYASKNLVCKAK